MSWWPLADPLACPGLFDLLVVIVSRTWRTLPLGSLLITTNIVMLVFALLLLARALHAITRTLIVTIAITLAAAASAEFVRVLAPAPAGALLITIAAWQAVLHNRRPLVWLAMLAATVPAFTIPLALLAGWLSRPQGTIRAAVSALTVIAVSIGIQAALWTSPSPDGSMWGCLIPMGGLRSGSDAGLALVRMLTINPLASALALFGLLSLRHLPLEWRRSLVALVLIALWGVSVTPWRPAAAMAPFFLAFWVLSAAGLTEVWTSASQTIAGKVGTATLALTLVVLQTLNASGRRNVHAVNDGHAELTVAAMTTIVNALPKGAALVEEDALTSLLIRALPSRLRSDDRFHLIGRNSDAVRKALQAGAVYVLPRSQRVLQHVALELGEPAGGTVPGLAEIRQAHQCSSELGPSPEPVPSIVGGRGFALVAADEHSRDRVVIFLAGDAPISAAPLGWPVEPQRNIRGRMFDLERPEDQTDLSDELRSHDLSSWPIPNSGQVTRIEVWRTAGSPLVLPIALGNPPTAAIARRTGTSSQQHLRLCTSYPFEVRPLAQRP